MGWGGGTKNRTREENMIQKKKNWKQQAQRSSPIFLLIVEHQLIPEVTIHTIDDLVMIILHNIDDPTMFIIHVMDDSAVVIVHMMNDPAIIIHNIDMCTQGEQIGNALEKKNNWREKIHQKQWVKYHL